MDYEPLHYLTGEEIHAADRVQYRGEYARVVFVSNGETEEFSPGYEAHTGADRGLILCDDDGSINSISDPDGMLTFLDRG
jgi:hypothetical protein